MPNYDRFATNDVQTGEYAQESWQYDSVGRTTVAIDANNHSTDYGYDSLGRLVTITSPADVTGGTRAQTSFTYDDAGRKTTETDPTGNVTQFFYNPIGKLIKTLYPDGSAEETIYATTGNTIGLPIKLIDRGGESPNFNTMMPNG